MPMTIWKFVNDDQKVLRKGLIQGYNLKTSNSDAYFTSYILFGGIFFYLKSWFFISFVEKKLNILCFQKYKNFAELALELQFWSYSFGVLKYLIFRKMNWFLVNPKLVNEKKKKILYSFLSLNYFFKSLNYCNAHSYLKLSEWSFV